jgi:hypothetical protein
MVKKKGKRKKRKTKVKFKRAPSKLPANRVVSANQYLHLQRQIDEMKMVPTRGNRQADYHASQGNPYASASAAQREIIDTLRMTPDIMKGFEKKEQDNRYRKLIEEQERLRDAVASITPDLQTHRREGTPSRQSDRSRSSYEASAHTSSSSSEGETTKRQIFGAFRHTTRERAEHRRATARQLQAAAQQRGVTLTEDQALGHTHRGSYTPSDSRDPGKVQGRRDMFKAGFGKDSGSVWAPGASSSPQTKWGWDDDGD